MTRVFDTISAGLFEKYMATVEQTRTTTFDFWSECAEDFHDTGKAEIEKSLTKIDSPDNMGIEFVEGRWIVYDMTRKAGANNQVICNTVAGALNTRVCVHK